MDDPRTLPATLMLPLRTVTGRGCLKSLLEECEAFGKHGCLVHGRSLAASGVLDVVRGSSPDSLRLATREHEGGEPTVQQVDDLRGFLKETGVSWVCAIGGGSVIDLAKAAAGLMKARLPASEYQAGAALPHSSVSFIAVPTTAGTGSEATIVSVLTDTRSGLKRSIRHPSHMAQLVLLDSSLLSSCPEHVIANSGMDAFVQAVEAYMSRKATVFTDVIARQALGLINGSLEKVHRDSACRAADQLMTGSFLAGVALSNARLGLVHGLAHPLGARYMIPHGLVCGVCMPHVLEFNRGAIEEKYGRASKIVEADLGERILELLKNLELSSPFAGRDIVDRSAIVEEALASGSTRANPKDVGPEDVERILDRMFADVS